MTIQWIGPEDGEAVRRLWQDCFHDPESYADFYFQTVARRNRISGIKKDGRLVSMIHLNPYVLSADKRRFDSTYIVGVATDEAYRHQGCMRRLLYGTFDCLYREKQPFTYLMPADRKIYEPFGFRYIYRQFFARAAKRERAGHYMRAAGDVKYSMTLSMISMWVFRVSLCIFLIRVMGFGPMAVWIGMFTDWTVRGIGFLHRFHSRKWLDHKVI